MSETPKQFLSRKSGRLSDKNRDTWTEADTLASTQLGFTVLGGYGNSAAHYLRPFWMHFEDRYDLYAHAGKLAREGNAKAQKALRLVRETNPQEWETFLPWINGSQAESLVGRLLDGESPKDFLNRHGVKAIEPYMRPWNMEDNADALGQGWVLAHDGRWNVLYIEMVDDGATFSSDGEAWKFVFEQALAGETVARKALYFASAPERAKIRRHLGKRDPRALQHYPWFP